MFDGLKETLCAGSASGEIVVKVEAGSRKGVPTGENRSSGESFALTVEGVKDIRGLELGPAR